VHLALSFGTSQPPVNNSGQIVSFAAEPNGSVEQLTSARSDSTQSEGVLKKISYLVASAVSALAAMLPVSSSARTPEPAVRDPSAATELARPADTIRVSMAARDQIGTKARGLFQEFGEGVADLRLGLRFAEEIPQTGRRRGLRFAEEIPQTGRRPGLRFAEEIPQTGGRR